MDASQKPLAPLSEEEHHPAIVRVADATIRDANALLHANDGPKSGRGMIGTILALVLGFLCLLGVPMFHFPQYLTTPELWRAYSMDVIRQILFVSLLIPGGLSLANIVLDNRRCLNGLAFLFVMVAVALSGSRMPVGDFPDHIPCIGMNWFILDLLGLTAIFVLLEKLFPLYKKQPVFRAEWRIDMVHLVVNHFVVGLVLLVVNFPIHQVFGWMVHADLQQMVQHIWSIPQLLLYMLVADLMEYVTHRAHRGVPFLRRFHTVHHSVKTTDWLAGSRQHILELIIMRVAVLGPLFVLGFDKAVVDVYTTTVGFQAVFNHANVHLPWGPLKYIFVTPDFHHWHHSSEDEAIDKNYAARFVFIDYLSGTAVKSKKAFPEKYGVVGDYMSDGSVNQQRSPFRRQQN